MFKNLLIGLLLFGTLSSIAQAFEGKLLYRVHTDDIDWTMECYVKDDLFKAEIYYDGTLYQSLLRNNEGVLIINEHTQQAATAYHAKQRWGQDKVEKKIKNPKLPEPVEFRDTEGRNGLNYRIRESGKTFMIEILDGFGSMPRVVFDQFSTLKPLGKYGYPLFELQSGVPSRIYYKNKSKTPILELVSVSAMSIEDERFVIPSDYNRTEMQFKSR
jgi:hypothetical protein